MDVLVIEPGHGSLWLENAVYLDRFNKPNPRGKYVCGTVWSRESGSLDPDPYVDIPEVLTYPRKWILKVAL